MAILQKLKSLLGLGDSSSDAERRHDRDVGVTIERESGRSDEAAEPDDQSVDAGPVSSPKDESEADTKEGEAEAPSEDDTVSEQPLEDEAGEVDETEEVDDTDDTEVVDEEDEADEPAERAEQMTSSDDEGAAAGSSASSSTDTMVEPTESPEAAAEPAEATGPTEENAAPKAEKAGESVEPIPVDDIKGIGPAYSDRLADAGVMTVSELAAADAAKLAEETDIAEKRIQGWIDRAKVR